MKILDTVRRRGSSRDPAAGGDNASGEFPIERYERLDAKAISLRLPGLSQEQLAMVEEREREHGNRAPVLDKLRYLRQAEPIEGYDRLDSRAVREALAGCDVGTVRSVRDYERKFAHRQGVLAETARLLVPGDGGTSPPARA